MPSLHVRTMVLATGILTCAMATDSFAEPDKSLSRPDNVIASLNLDDGVIMQFVETEPGQLAVMAQGRITGLGGVKSANINGVNVSKLDGLNAVEKYALVTGGHKPPAALIAAQQRLDATTRKAIGAAAPAAQKKQAPSADKHAKADSTVVAPAFTCGWDSWSTCWYWRTNDYSYQRYTYYMKSFVEVYRGNLLHSLWRYDSPYWNRSIYQWVYQGNWGWLDAWGGSYWKKSTLEYAYGDGYHLSIWGH